jgi:hypothetical protein
MLCREFEKLKIVDMSNTSVRELSCGDYFLTPELEGQILNKKAGDTVTVYYITEVRPNGNIMYSPRYLTLEEY